MRLTFRWFSLPNTYNKMLEEDLRLSWFNIYAYGCRVYALKQEVCDGKEIKSLKVDTRAYLGYFVGYNARNLYRVWIPALNRVIISRDVLFDEQTFFDLKNEAMELDILEFQRFVETMKLESCAEFISLEIVIPDFEALMRGA